MNNRVRKCANIRMGVSERMSVSACNGSQLNRKLWTTTKTKAERKKYTIINNSMKQTKATTRNETIDWTILLMFL